MAVRVQDLPQYTAPLEGSERLLVESHQGTGLVAYPRLWKPTTALVETFLTGSLANLAVELGIVTLAPVVEVLQVVLSQAARLRVYSSVAARTADASRLVSVWAQPGAGLILEVVSVGALVQSLDPHAWGVNQDDLTSAVFPYALQNLGVLGSVSVALTYIDRS